MMVSAAALPAVAMRIVITNDDGFESRNIQALFFALRAAGHDVILSAPYRNQSGASAQLGSLSDIPRTNAPSPGGTIASGAPGVGPTTIAADQYYVDSSPIGAVLYGIDVVAQAKWGVAPDLVISGPNIGNNLGVFIPHSGTIGVAITVLNRGIPSIAVSAAPTIEATVPLLTAITLRMIGGLEDRGKIALPPGIGLNVNIPILDANRTAASYRLAFTQIGFGADPSIRFTSRAGDDSRRWTTDTTGTAVLSSRTGLPIDANQGSETNAFADGNTVTVSPIQGTYQARPEQAVLMMTQMRGLFTSSLSIANPKLVNISMRGHVGVGSAVQIAGFFVSGNAAKTVLIRASGPALASFGVSDALVDPMLELFDREGRLVGTNDNWSDDGAKVPAIADAAARVGAFAWSLGGKDAALVVALAPGPYTVVVRGVEATTGVVLVEVYDINVD